MNEPAAIWGFSKVVFDQEISRTQNIILSHGREALNAVLERIEALRKLIQSSPLVNAYPAPEIPSVLSDLCYQAGLASTILFNDIKKGRRESEIAYRLRRERVDYVQKWCNTQYLNISILRNRDLRNALTHIDEHLADALAAEPNVGWFIDSAIASRREFSPPDGIKMAFCRSYISDEDIIVHLGHEVTLRELANECAAVLAVVFGCPPRKF
jgi:hypothetical protein